MPSPASRTSATVKCWLVPSWMSRRIRWYRTAVSLALPLPQPTSCGSLRVAVVLLELTFSIVTRVWRLLSRTCFSFVSCRGGTTSQGRGQLPRWPGRQPQSCVGGEGGPKLTSSSLREVTTASIIFRGLFTLETVSFPSEPSNCTAGSGEKGSRGSQGVSPGLSSPPFISGPGPGCVEKGALTWLVGVLQLSHLRCDEFSAFLLGTITVDFLRC